MSSETTSKNLRTVPREKAFYFFTSIGNYTGESAASLKEFIDKINVVNLKSLEFHLYRGDFEKWLAEVLEDKDLAEELRRMQKINPAGDTLRIQLHSTVSKHYYSLTNRPVKVKTEFF